MRATTRRPSTAAATMSVTPEAAGRSRAVWRASLLNLRVWLWRGWAGCTLCLRRADLTHILD
eukprot:2274467-Rhodomonas_salina.1